MQCIVIVIVIYSEGVFIKVELSGDISFGLLKPDVENCFEIFFRPPFYPVEFFKYLFKFWKQSIVK